MSDMSEITVKEPPLQSIIFEVKKPDITEFALIADIQTKLDAWVDSCINHVTEKQPIASSVTELGYRFEIAFYKIRITQIQYEADELIKDRVLYLDEQLLAKIKGLPDHLIDKPINTQGWNPNQVKEGKKEARNECEEWLKQTAMEMERQKKILLERDTNLINDFKEKAINACKQKIQENELALKQLLNIA